MEDKDKNSKIKTRSGSGYLRQLYSTARSSTENTHSHLKNRTTILVNFVPVEKIDASELQVRTHFDDSEIEALSHSIKEHGVLQPILVVQDGDRYKVIAGERRLRATKLAGLDRIPARVITSTDRGTHEIALRENLDRVDLHPIEEGEAYLSLLEAKAYSSYDAIAKGFGKSKSRITECIGFTRLPEETKVAIMTKNLKNRALMRQLLNSPPQTHEDLIREVDGQEEELVVKKPNKPKPTTPKSEPKPFSYKCNKKGIVVPAFRWKVGEGPEKLKSYVESLQKLIQEAESQYISRD